MNKHEPRFYQQKSNGTKVALLTGAGYRGLLNRIFGYNKLRLAPPVPCPNELVLFCQWRQGKDCVSQNRRSRCSGR